MGALSFSPSPMTTTPCIDTELISIRMALTAAPSAPFLSPRPTQRAAAIEAASVTLASSSARFRSGACLPGSGTGAWLPGPGWSGMPRVFTALSVDITTVPSVQRGMLVPRRHEHLP
jgi:hypothetical protein